MTSAVPSTLEMLSDIQREAAQWKDGAALVLAGPGSGKTSVLTARIAKILDDSPDKNFRVLALTFTTKAAAEMRDRVDFIVPGKTERTFIGTFHAFCTQMLRQHGSHIGISTDFAIFDQDADREELLSEALSDASRKGEPVSSEDVRWLRTIDQLKSKLVVPEKAAAQFRDANTGASIARIYTIYEQALRLRNATDFNGLILGACRLLRDVEGVAERTRRSYRYWLIDEFQDTSPAQYKLLSLAAGQTFKNVFTVADDDQIIYQWAGASYRQIESFRTDFRPVLFQLVENHRCPPEIVAAGNRLVAKNTFRTPDKKPLIAARAAAVNSIVLRQFDSDVDERDGIADEIASANPQSWGRTAVLGRTRFLLTPIVQALQARGVKAALFQRRDRFISPQFTWLQACLDQALRPTDQRTFRTLVGAANRITEDGAKGELEADRLIAEAEAQGLAYFDHWGRESQTLENALAARLGECAVKLAASRAAWKQVVKTAVPLLIESAKTGDGLVSDADDDKAAWDACMREMRAEKGSELELDEVIQGLALRSKEPPRDPDALTLLTIHGAKGLEFDIVYVVGLAEAVMPSWQSVSKGDSSAEMEEERRNCFVAITRTRQRLTLSRADSYNGYAKKPSRFLAEMGFT